MRVLRIAALPAAVVACAPALALATPSAVVDTTVTCTNLVKGGLPVFSVTAAPTGKPDTDADGKLATPPPGFHAATGLGIESGDVLTLLTLPAGPSGYQLDRSHCRATTARPRLSPRGLAHVMTLNLGDVQEFERRCVDVGRMVFRIRIVNDAHQIPLRAQLLVRRAKTGRPLVYVDWTRDRVDTFAAAGCTEP